MATASPAYPWLAIEGDTVSVQLARAHVLATAVGPAVPEEGHFPVPPATRCTFTFTLARASGTVPSAQPHSRSLTSSGTSTIPA